MRESRQQTMSSEQQKAMAKEGYVIIPGVLTERECNEFSRLLDEIWVREHLSETHNYEPGVQFVPNLLQYSASFQRCVTDPIVLTAVRLALGPSIRLNRIRADVPILVTAIRPCMTSSARAEVPISRRTLSGAWTSSPRSTAQPG